MSVVDPLIRNQFTKRALVALGRKREYGTRQTTAHYRMPSLEDNGGYMVLRDYDGPAVDPSEWERLEYVTYATDPNTYFAPLTSADGAVAMQAFSTFGRSDLEALPTANAEKAPTLMRFIESVGVPYGKVQLLRQQPNSRRETLWGLHYDDNNTANPTERGWAVRMWFNLTDDPGSALILRRSAFDRGSEVAISMHRNRMAVVDSQALLHGAHHAGDRPRYALITTFESSPELEAWMLARRA